MRIRKRIEEGGKYPWGYGRTYYKWNEELHKFDVFCHPVPLNIIINFIRNVYFTFAHGLNPNKYDFTQQDYKRQTNKIEQLESELKTLKGGV